MPSAAVDPSRVPAMRAGLAPLAGVAREGADEVLGHFTDLGDPAAQTALDGYLELVADALQEIDRVAADLDVRLAIASKATTRGLPR